MLAWSAGHGISEREKTVAVFITKLIIKLHLDYYIHKVTNILQIDKKCVKLPWMIAVCRFAFTISLIIERHSVVRECADGNASV
jgi:hypothetical protein